MTLKTVALFLLLVSLWPPAQSIAGDVTPLETEGRFDHATLDTLLRSVVHGDLVDYAAVQEQRALLDRYLGQVAGAGPEQLPGRSDSLAFFINAYNANVLALVADRYPALRSVLDEPKDGSPGFFKQRVLVAGSPITLDGLEHKILRSRFDEARIHFAINCASVSCPPLRSRAYRAKGLEEQLEEITRNYINNPAYNRYDAATGRLYLSQVFEWFPMDFARASGSVEAFFFAYLDGYGPNQDIPRAEVLFLPYDWRLNAWKR